MVEVIHFFQQLDFDPSLGTEGGFVLDDLHSYLRSVVVVNGLDDLPKGPLAKQLPNFVPLKPHLPGLHDVVVVLVVMATIESILLGKCSLFGIINLKVKELHHHDDLTNPTYKQSKSKVENLR